MKKILLTSALFAMVGLAVASYLYNKPHEDMASAKASFTLPATSLFTEYEVNESVANERYLGKVIEVTGEIQEIKKDEEGKTSITLNGGNMMFGVICKLDYLIPSKRTDYNIGEKVTFKGRCTGMLMDVLLVRCVEM